MQNVVISMCEKFHNDRLRNDRSFRLENGKSDNNKERNNVGSAWGPVVSGFKKWAGNLY